MTDTPWREELPKVFRRIAQYAYRDINDEMYHDLRIFEREIIELRRENLALRVAQLPPVEAP